jgi:hypothetical protein
MSEMIHEPTATSEAPQRRDPPPLLYDPRVPEAVRQIACLALDAGHDVSMSEGPGDTLCAASLNLVAHVPWDSDFGRALRAHGANNNQTDDCSDAVSEEHQSVLWETSLAETPRLFRLVRDRDASGVSGTGHVADGVLWHDGTCAIRWRTDTRSTTVYDSLADVEKIHGHRGATRVEWYEVCVHRWLRTLDGRRSVCMGCDAVQRHTGRIR